MFQKGDHISTESLNAAAHYHQEDTYTLIGSGNPLQCSCLENPRDGAAWWAAVCGVAQSRTRLKRRSSSSIPSSSLFTSC